MPPSRLNGAMSLPGASTCSCESEFRNHRSGHRVCIVTSGAVGMGCQVMHVAEPPRDLASRQALAAIGQGALLRVYSDFFAALHVVCCPASHVRSQAACPAHKLWLPLMCTTLAHGCGGVHRIAVNLGMSWSPNACGCILAALPHLLVASHLRTRTVGRLQQASATCIVSLSLQSAARLLPAIRHNALEFSCATLALSAGVWAGAIVSREPLLV